MTRRRRRRGAFARSRERLGTAALRAGRQVTLSWHAAHQRIRPWKPEVLVDAKRSRARRLRRMVSRATRAQFRALGVMPPGHLLIVVQRTVLNGGHAVASLLQVYEDASGARRHVLFLALAVGDETAGDAAVVATLRQQLHEVVGDGLGSLVREVACEPVRRPRPAGVVPLRRPQVAPPQTEDEVPFPDDTDAPIAAGDYAVAAER